MRQHLFALAACAGVLLLMTPVHASPLVDTQPPVQLALELKTRSKTDGPLQVTQDVRVFLERASFNRLENVFDGLRLGLPYLPGTAKALLPDLVGRRATEAIRRAGKDDTLRIAIFRATERLLHVLAQDKDKRLAGRAADALKKINAEERRVEGLMP